MLRVAGHNQSSDHRRPEHASIVRTEELPLKIPVGRDYDEHKTKCRHNQSLGNCHRQGGIVVAHKNNTASTALITTTTATENPSIASTGFVTRLCSTQS